MNPRTLLVPFLLLPAILCAAEEKASDTLRCRVFAAGKAPSGLHVKTAGRYEPLSISTDFVGKSFRTDAREGIVFYRKTPEAEGKAADHRSWEAMKQYLTSLCQ